MFSIFEKLASITIKIKNIFSPYRINSPSLNFGKGNLFLTQGVEIEPRSEEIRVAKELWNMVVKRIGERVDYGRNYDAEKLKKIASRLTLTGQYFDQKSIYFDKELKEIFIKLYNELKVSYSSEGAVSLRNLFDLKDLLEQKIQRIIKRD